MIRFFLKPRLNYLDCIVIGASLGLVPYLGAWALALALVGAFVSAMLGHFFGVK